MSVHDPYMHRCHQLARLGAGAVAPNPMVGAVLVHQNRIIGEGYHQRYGEPHAEVNCINSVAEADRNLISESVLYVSLEPCNHFGKTPPCSDLIIRYKIPTVVIGTRDPFVVPGLSTAPQKGIEKLRAAGVQVELEVLGQASKDLNKRFFIFQQQKSPYIILKWAQTADGKISGGYSERLLISNDITNRLVHQWRSKEGAILIGTTTALMDDPALNNRLWPGPVPLRLVVDLSLRLPKTLRIFDDSQPTIIFNTLKSSGTGNTVYHQLSSAENLVPQILLACYERNIQSVLVEGGARLLQSFIDEGAWHEARVITNNSLYVGEGLAAPVLKDNALSGQENILTDSITYFSKK